MPFALLLDPRRPSESEKRWPIDWRPGGAGRKGENRGAGGSAGLPAFGAAAANTTIAGRKHAILDQVIAGLEHLEHGAGRHLGLACSITA